MDVATSSSDLAWRAAERGAPHGSGFLVAEQTAGRGRRGARWRSGRGGMYFSIVLRPDFARALWPGLSFVAGLAIGDEIGARLDGGALALKWPNDVIAGGGITVGGNIDAGIVGEGKIGEWSTGAGKIGGVLLEARDDAVVVGTGVNIAAQPTMEGASLRAVSMAELGAGDTSPEELARAYARNLLGRVARFASEGFAPVRAEWLGRCAHIGGRLRVRLGGEVIEGAFADMDMDGALLLDTGAAAPRRITTGDVELMGRDIDAACD